MTRRPVAVLVLGALVVLSGCTAFGGGEVNTQRLGEEASYDWSPDTDARIDIDGDEYTAVYRFENRTEVELFRFFRLNNKRPLNAGGLKFRYSNGTVVNHTAMDIEKTRSRLIVTLPASEGQLAYTAPTRGKRLRLPVIVEGGSYEVVLPPGTRVKYFLIGRVTPGGYDRTIEENRVHLQWSAVDRDRIVVRYYLQRDLYLFAGLVATGLAVAIGGLAYFLLRLRRLRRRREEVGLDVDTEGDDDLGGGGGPPLP